MIHTIRYTMLAMMMTLILAACGAAPSTAPAPAQPTAAVPAVPTAEAMMEPTAEAMMEPTAETMAKPTSETMMEPTGEAMAEPTTAPAAEAMAEPTAEAMPEEAWQIIPLTNARTGESFTLGDFAGRPVYVETMATWCSNCRTQLVSVQEAITTLQGQPPVFIAISVEANLPPEQLAGYAADNGFDMLFAVASPELLKALTDTFGRTITNPPSTPHFIIAPDGSYSQLMTGYSPAEKVVTLLTSAGGGA